MKLWGWWRREPDSKPESDDSKPQMLEDLPPKFHDDVEKAQRAQELARPRLSQVLSSLSLQDFQHISEIPCFRNAILTGLGMGTVAGGVIFVSKRSASRTVNWTLTGFLIGSIMSWEQCRFRMKRGKRNMQHAQELYKSSSAEKEK